jgi:hypothetical protein
VRRAAALAALACLAGCGSGSSTDSREEALRGHLGPLRGARVSCEEKSCTVTAERALLNVYSATLVAAPVIERALDDPDLDDLEAISVNLDDAVKEQVFSIRCETDEVTRPVTIDALRTSCHSIFT